MIQGYSDKSTNKAITFLLVFGPVLNVYGIGVSGLSFANIIFMLIIGVSFFKHRFIWCTGFGKAINTYICYFLLMLTVSLLNCMLGGYSVASVVVRHLVYAFYIMLIYEFAGKRIINGEYAYNIWKILAMLASSALLIQVFAHYLLKKDLFFLIPFFKYNQSTLPNYSSYVATYLSEYRYNFRPSSIFLEPSQFSLFVSPILALILNKEKISKKDFALSMLISIAVILSTSGTGYLLVFISWMNFLLKVLKRREVESWKLFFMVLAIVVIIYTVLSSEYLSTLLARIGSINNGDSSSINVRLVKGFHFYSILNPVEKFFGIGAGNYDAYILTHPYINSKYAYEYMNSIAELLVSTGILGFVIVCYLLLQIRDYLRKSGLTIMFWIILAMYFTGSVLFSWYDCLPIIVSVAMTEEKLRKFSYEKNYC